MHLLTKPILVADKSPLNTLETYESFLLSPPLRQNKCSEDSFLHDLLFGSSCLKKCPKVAQNETKSKLMYLRIVLEGSNPIKVVKKGSKIIKFHYTYD